MKPLVSVLLIRENAEQLTGSGCCGKLEGDYALAGGADLFAATRQQQRALAELANALRARFREHADCNLIEITVVDPRNQLYLASKLIRDVVRYRPSWRAGLCTVLQLYSLPAVIVNGRILSRRHSPLSSDELCRAVQVELQR